MDARTIEAIARRAAIFDAAFEFIGLLALDGTLLEANRAALEFAGVAREDVVGRAFWDTPWWQGAEEAERARLRQAVADAAAGRFVRYEVTHRGRAGARLTVDFSLTPIREDGALACLVAEGRDVTEHRRMEGALRLSEARLAGIVELAAEAVVSVDEEQRITLFNRAAERMFGYEAGEVLGRPLDLLLPEHVVKAHRKHVAALPRDGAYALHMSERRELAGRRRGGELFPAEISISSFDVGGRAVYTALLRDVSQRRAMEQRTRDLLARETAARAAAELAEHRSAFIAEVSALLDASLDLDETLRTIAGLFVPELASCALVDVVEGPDAVRRVGVAHADDRMAAAAEWLRAYPRETHRPFLSQRSIRGEAELVSEVTAAWLETHSPDPEHLATLRSLEPTSFLSVPMTAGGTVLGAISLLSCGGGRRYRHADLALVEEVARRAGSAVERARLYARARRAAEMRDRTLALVAHDLRGPLSAVTLAARALEAATVPGEPGRDAAHTILDSVHLMQRLIQDLLDVASMEAGHFSIQPRRADPVVLLVRAADLFEPVAADRGVWLGLELPDTLPAVEADAERIMQLVGNLLDNAIKHTPAGGGVTLRAAERDGGGVVVEVRDTGCGIAPDDLPHVFDRFWHVQREGKPRSTGLGLAIAREIVEAHGGTIDAESEVEVGSVFRFTLPAVGGAAAPAASRVGELPRVEGRRPTDALSAAP